jgi:hypothetical protein
MGTPAGFTFSGRALIIFAVALFIISGLLIGGVDRSSDVRVVEANGSQVSPDDEVLRYNNLSEGGQDVFDQELRTDGYTRVYQSPPDFNFPDDTMDYTYVAKNGTIYSVGTGLSNHMGGLLVDTLGIVVGLAGITLLVLGVSRRRNGETNATEDNNR